METSGCDLFVSYKHEDADMVRPAVDALIAAGVDVWFAEWRILFANWERFEGEIDRVIPLSRYALIFANERWGDSDYCRKEAAAILANLPADRIVVVETGGCNTVYDTFPGLRDCVVLPQSSSGSISDVVKAVIDKLHITAEAAATRWLAKAGSYVPVLPLDKYGLQVDVEQFRPVSLDRPAPRVEAFAGQYQCDDGKGDLQLSMWCFPYSNAFAEISDSDERSQSLKQDLEPYQKLMVYADLWTERHGYRPKGLHFIECGVGSPQAFTYTYDSIRGQNNRVWERRYIVYYSGERGTTAEVHFLFSKLYPKSGLDNKDLMDFCACSALFERIVHSASYDPSKSRIGPYAVGQACLRTAAACLAVAVAAWRPSVTSLFVATSVGGDAVLSWSDRKYLRLQSMALGGPTTHAAEQRCSLDSAFIRGALADAPRALVPLLALLLRSGAWVLGLLLCVVGFNQILPQYALPLEEARTVVPMVTLSTLIVWRRRRKALKTVT